MRQMKPTVHKEKSQAIIYDANRVELPVAEQFDAGFWNNHQAVQGQASGRGSAWFIDTKFGPVVLRRYLRGGWAAKISREHYVFTGVLASRPFREFRLLTELYEMGLPVPCPVAALCKHHGIFSTGAIMTMRIAGARSLADLLSSSDITNGQWHRIWADTGRCIHRFHTAGLWHADLNAGNILIDQQSKVFLIDFDQARLTAGTPVNGGNNLSRLNRSLLKLWPESRKSLFPAAWAGFIEAYHG